IATMDSGQYAVGRGEARRALPLPVGSVLRDPVREPSVVRMWHSVESRLRAETPARPWRVIAWVSLGALVAMLAMFAVGSVDRGPIGRAARVVEAGLLLTSGGRPLGVVDVPEDGKPRSVVLADGSHIALGGNTRLEPLASSGREFIVRLAHGRGTFD